MGARVKHRRKKLEMATLYGSGVFDALRDHMLRVGYDDAHSCEAMQSHDSSREAYWARAGQRCCSAQAES